MEYSKSDPSGRFCMAEREGFEPSIPLWGIPDFESGAFDHSATSPKIASESYRSTVFGSSDCGAIVVKNITIQNTIARSFLKYGTSTKPWMRMARSGAMA